jgi:hypothetical protein
MGAHPRLTVQAGARSRSLLVYAADAADPTRPKSGLLADASGVSAAAIRAGDRDPYPIRLTPGTVDSFVPGGWLEVDPGIAPGVYRFGVPNAVLAAGSWQVVLEFRFPGAKVDPVEIALVAFDPQEPERIGMQAQVWEERQAFLREGLPRLAEMELALQEEAAERRVEARARLAVGGSEPEG